MAGTVPFGKTNGGGEMQNDFFICYTNSNKNLMTAEGGLCPSKSFDIYASTQCFSFCGGNRSYDSVKVEFILPLSR